MTTKPFRPGLEPLEDRLTPALTYLLDAAGNLSVTGQTPNASVTVTSAPGNSVTVIDGAALKTFAVPGNLTVNIQSLTPTLTFSYTPGANQTGNVSLTATSLGAVNVFVSAIAPSTIAGSLSIKTGAGNDAVDLSIFGGAFPLTVAGSVSIDTGAGTDTVVFGATAAVNVNGNLFVYNANTVVFAASPVVVGGLTNITTDVIPGGTNVVVTGMTTAMAGNFLMSGSASGDVVVLAGTIAGSATVNLDGGNNTLVTTNTSVIAGNFFVLTGAGDDTVVLSGLVAGSVTANLGNGTNTATFGGTVAGPTIAYYGGNGTDSVTYTGTAPGARLTALLGGGDDTFTLSSNSLKSAYLDGGFGANTFTASVLVNFPLTLVNFL